jgi:predicted metal-dependent HD superfamily phosphohydrolase
MRTDQAELLARWRALVPAADALGEDLLTRWSQPHRHYHTTGHLAAVLALVDRYADLAPDIDAVRLAGWFHDAVYDPRAGDNEERSAELAETWLPGAGVPAARVAQTARLVRLTAGHAVAGGDADGALLADADLAILAADRGGYDRYAAAIRREYAHVPEDAFRAGRAIVLAGLLALPALYRIVPPRSRWEVRARANLERELRDLAQRPKRATGPWRATGPP